MRRAIVLIKLKNNEVTLFTSLKPLFDNFGKYIKSDKHNEEYLKRKIQTAINRYHEKYVCADFTIERRNLL